MKDVTLIRVGKDQIGLRGLKEALADIAEHHRELCDEDIGKLILEWLSKKNYIVERLYETYAKAFLREYKKYIGETVEEEVCEGIRIKILGPGCARCEKMEQDVMVVLAEKNLTADVEHIRDLDEIARYGVMGTPALVINDDVKTVGNLPPKSKLKIWLDDAGKAVNV